MREETERMMRAYLRVYSDFMYLYDVEYGFSDEKGIPQLKKEPGDVVETAILFQAALQDTLLSELLRQEIVERYNELKQEEEQQTAQPAAEAVE